MKTNRKPSKPSRALNANRLRTPRAGANENLSTREKPYGFLLKNINGAVYRSRNDQNWTLEDISEGCAMLTGYQPDELIDNRVTSLGALIHPEDAGAVWAKCQTNLAAHKTCSNEYRIYHRNGDIRWVWDQAQGIYSETGELLYIEGLLSDITERKLSEIVIRETEKRYKEVVDNASDIIYSTTLEGKITHANPAALRAIGYSFEELTKLSWLDIVVPEYQSNVKRVSIRQFLKKTPAMYMEFPIATFSGDIRWLGQNASLILEDQNPVGFHVIARDITERRRAEENLKKTEIKYRTLVEQISPIVYMAERDQHIGVTYISPRIESFGFTQEEWLADPELWLKQIHPDDQPRVLEKIKQIRYSDKPFKEEYRLSTRDGVVKWILDEVVNVTDENGNTLFRQGSMLDITENKKVEEAVRTSERRFRALIENGLDFISLLDAEGKLVWESPSSSSLLGYPFNEFLGRNIFELMHPADVDSTRQQFGDLVKTPGNRNSGIFRLRHADGSWRWMEANASNYLHEPSVNAIVINYRDISERKQAELILKEAETRYRTLVEQLPIVVYMNAADDPTFTTYVSPQVEVMLGYSTEEWLADPTLWSKVLHPEDRSRVLAEAGRIAVTGESFDMEYRILTRDGRTVWLNDQVMLIRDEAGNPQFWQGFMMDITKRRLVEDALREREFWLGESQRVGQIGSYSLDLEKNIWVSSKGLDDIFGIHPNAEKTVSSWSALIHPEQRDELLSYFTDNVLKNHELFNKEYRIVRPRDGEVRWVWGRGELAFGADGAPTRMFGTIQDVTDRRQVDERLMKSEQRYRALFENMPIAIWEEDFSGVKKHLEDLRQQGVSDFQAYFTSHPELVKDIADKIEILDVNKTAVEMFQAQSKEELINSTYQVSSPGELEHNLDDLLAIAAGKTANHWEGRDETLDGKSIEIRLNWSVVPGHEDDYSRVIVTTIDITEQKRADKTLQAAEAKYRALVEQIPAAVYIWELGKDGNCLYISPRIEHMLGFSTEAWLTDPGLFFKQVHPDDGEVVLAAENHSRDSGEPVQSEFRMLTRDGRVIWVRDESLVLPQETGKPRLNQGLLSDITERKRAEEALRVSEQRYRSLFEDSPISLWEEDFSKVKERLDALRARGVTDFKSYFDAHPEEVAQCANLIKVVDVNKATLELYGADSKEHFFAHVSQIFQPESYVGFVTEFVYIAEGHKHFIWEAVNKTINGRLINTSLGWSVAPGHEGDLSKVIVSILDITERKRSEAEITRHLSELEVLYKNSLAINRLINPGMIGKKIIEILQQKLDWHHAAIRLADQKTGKLEIVALSDPRFGESDIKEQITRLNQSISHIGSGLSGWVIQQGEPLRIAQVATDPHYIETYPGIQSGLYVPIKIGERSIGSIAVESEIEDAFTELDERLLMTIASQAAASIENAQLYELAQMELSERTRAEQELRHAHAELEKRVRERTADLSHANVNLARALKVKDEFLANMSHELRTPLNAILGLSESLSEQVAGSLNEKQQKYIQTISESGHHLLALINDILDLAKIEAGQITLDIAKVDVNTVCQSSLRMVKQLAQKKNQQVTLEIDDKFELIWADERRLKQMIVNLLSNAVKFTPVDGKVGIEVRGDASENRVLITVWDTGIGIGEEDAARLFQPFVQLSTGLARESSGTGLGLALVAQMAKLHGGGVSVSSVLNQGSRFTLVLPWEPMLAQDTIERMKSTGKFRAVKSNGTQGQYTILLIEDTPEVVMLIQDYLELAGYKVAVAGDGLDGIALAKRIHPNLILMDLQMPRLDGIEATKKLRGDPEFVHTPIIALTALAMQGDRERCLAAGMDEYITKPVNLRTLVRIIETCLAHSSGGEPQLRGVTG